MSGPGEEAASASAACKALHSSSSAAVETGGGGLPWLGDLEDAVELQCLQEVHCGGCMAMLQMVNRCCTALTAHLSPPVLKGNREAGAGASCASLPLHSASTRCLSKEDTAHRLRSSTASCCWLPWRCSSKGGGCAVPQSAAVPQGFRRGRSNAAGAQSRRVQSFNLEVASTQA